MDLATELKAALAERDAAMKATFDKMSTKLDVLDHMQERIEGLEARRSSVGKTFHEKVSREHVQRFTSWLRKSTDPRREAELRDFQDKELKDVTIGCRLVAASQCRRRSAGRSRRCRRSSRLFAIS
jgi:hypothetical protein